MRPRRVPLLTAAVARQILDLKERVSLDLGLSESRVTVEEELAVFPGEERISLEDLEKVTSREDAVYFPENGSLYMVATSDDHFYKLVPTTGAPTIEIDGIRMHRTKGTTPKKDAAEKLEILGLEGGRVLDTCAGLGYTSVGALERGAELVLTVELEPPVLRIAELNPWSWRIFEDDRLNIVLGDSFNVVDALPEAFFDYVVHDPPRLAHAGHLYGLEFYRKIYRALRVGGRLFHYAGEPGSRHRGLDIRRGVASRLRRAGFRNVSYHREAMGLTCEKLNADD